MRCPAACVPCLVLSAALGSCRSQPAPPERSGAEQGVTVPSTSDSAPSRPALVIERELQATRLRLPPQRRRAPRLVFGSGALARLGDDSLEVLDDSTLRSLASVPLTKARAVVAMADGAFVAIGSDGLVRWERGAQAAPPLPRPMFLPGSELFADARQPDLLWIFEPDSAPPKLNSYRIGKPGPSALLLPEQTIELSSPRGGSFGVTREGVWLYVTSGRAERFAPGGLRLPGLSFAGDGVPTWLLPSRRLDQSAWLDENGKLTRALVSPVFKVLDRSTCVGAPYAADVGDAGRLLAVVTVTGAGPRFELVLFDADLRELGRAPLPADVPSGSEDWVRVVTRNQQLAAAPRGARVAVGGPERLTIYDDRAQVVLSIPIR